MSSLGSTTAATPASSSPTTYDAHPRSSCVSWRKIMPPSSRTGAGGPAGLLAVVRLGGALGHRDREPGRLLADDRVVDLGDAVDELDPLIGLEHRGDPAGGLGVGAVLGGEADVDVVVVVAHGE